MSSGIINRIAHHAWLSSLGLLLFASFIALGALPSGLTAPLARSAIGALRNWRAPQLARSAAVISGFDRF